MLHDMNVNSRPQRFVEAFLASTFNYFFDGEIASLRMLAMQQSRGNPDFVGDFQWRLGRNGHTCLASSYRGIFIITMYLRIVKRVCRAWEFAVSELLIC